MSHTIIPKGTIGLKKTPLFSSYLGISAGGCQQSFKAKSRNPFCCRFFKLSIGVVLLIRLFYIVSFPLEFGGDGSIYYTMILNRQSSLLMAAGYPFLMMLPYHWLKYLTSFFGTGVEDAVFTPWWQTATIRGDLMGTPISTHEYAWACFFQEHGFIVLQHAISLAALFCAFFLIRKYVGYRIALIFLFLQGIAPMAIELPSTVRPEWLQGAILIFWLVCAQRAKESTSSKSWLYYGALGWLSALGFLVKYNSLPILLLFFVALLFLARDEIGRLVAKTIVFIASAASMIALFILCYHLPTTGTSILSLNSWVMAVKYFQFIPQNGLSQDLGLYAKRLIAIQQNLPEGSGKDQMAAEYFRHLDAGPPERVQYQSNAQKIMQASDSELHSMFSACEFEPIREHDPTLKIAYYVGLKEYALLHQKIFFEAIQKYPLAFLLDTTKSFFRSFSVKDKSYVFRPEWNELMEGRYGNSCFGYTQFLWPKDRFVCYHENAAWLPGVWFFSKMQNFWPPTFLLWIFALIAGFSSFVSLQKKHCTNKTWLIAFVFLVLLIFIGLSCCISPEFRLKDLEFVRPLLSLLSSVGIYQSALLIYRYLTAFTFRLKNKEIFNDFRETISNRSF